MFQTLPKASPDPLLSILAAVNADTSDNKVDLGVGVYQDASGYSPVLRCVKQAEHWLVEQQRTKAYISSAGAPAFNSAMQTLIFGADFDFSRVRTCQTAGGSGALRIAAELILLANPAATIWVPQPTWANHGGIFKAAGAEVKTYPYFEIKSQRLLFGEMMDMLQNAAPNDVVVVHACCHNPSGADLSPEQWKTLTALIVRKSLFPLIDIAYQGFGAGLDEDTVGLRYMATQAPQMLVASSCSKNFGLYRDRVGALALVAEDAMAATNPENNMLTVIRTLYSMPPDHGAALVGHILGDPELKSLWVKELGDMRARIIANREHFAQCLAREGVPHDSIRHQNGMFCLVEMSADQVRRLREEHHIFAVGGGPAGGRINLAGLNTSNIEYVAAAFGKVL